MEGCFFFKKNLLAHKVANEAYDACMMGTSGAGKDTEQSLEAQRALQDHKHEPERRDTNKKKGQGKHKRQKED